MVLSNIESDLLQETSARTDRNVVFDNSSVGTVELDKKISRTIGYMRGSLGQPMQVSQLARMANISSSHFFAVFKQFTGFAPIDFFIRLRMRRASELLETTNLSVKEVAAALGYEDPFYFSRVFKSVHKVAPSEYRNLTTEGRETQAGPTGFRATHGIFNLLSTGTERQISPTPFRKPLNRTVANAGKKHSVKNVLPSIP